MCYHVKESPEPALSMRNIPDPDPVPDPVSKRGESKQTKKTFSKYLLNWLRSMTFKLFLRQYGIFVLLQEAEIPESSAGKAAHLLL
jgi:hypothetical protein